MSSPFTTAIPWRLLHDKQSTEVEARLATGLYKELAGIPSQSNHGPHSLAPLVPVVLQVALRRNDRPDVAVGVQVADERVVLGHLGDATVDSDEVDVVVHNFCVLLTEQFL